MKKILAMLLSVLLIAMSAGGLAESTEDTGAATDAGVQSGTELVVGTTSAMTGHFGTDLWGIDTSDMDVRALLHGYSTVSRIRMQGLTINTVAVAGIESEEQSDGSNVFTITLNDGLTYNDGTAITAQDYVFSLLFCGSPEVKSLGAAPAGKSHIMGYDEYASGASQTISGVRLLSSNSFSLHVRAEYYPFFYGLAMLDVQPYPISVIAPGCEVKDDGQGAYMGAAENAGAISASGYTPGDFSAEMLRVTLLDTESGYEYNPKVTSGPYTLESFDAATSVAKFVVNERFAGNYERQKPSIERLEYRLVENGTMIDQLANGEVGLLNKVMLGSSIEAGRVLSLDEGRAQEATYLRTGFAYLAFACEEGVTSSAAVRKAIAMCLDKDAVVSDIVSTSARRVYAYYGLGQWMATYSPDGSNEGETAINMQEEMAKLDVPKDLEAAKALLEEDGWTLNQNGDPFVEGTDTVRHRQGSGGLEPLVIEWAKTEGSEVAAVIETQLMETLPQVGISLVITEVPYEQMLQHYFREVPRTYNMFFVASNFNYEFDPYYDFNTADVYQGSVNMSGLKDEQLMNLALDLRRTDPGDQYGYAMKWLAFQNYFAEVMPMVPLYSNVYFDFFSNDLQGYDIVSHSGWAQAILYAHF